MVCFLGLGFHACCGSLSLFRAAYNFYSYSYVAIGPMFLVSVLVLYMLCCCCCF